MRTLAALSACLLVACSPASEPASDEPALVPLEHPHFTIRGRLPEPTIRYAYDATNSPVAEAQLRAACQWAAALWTETGVATILPAGEEDPNLRITFERDVHGPCTPFGRAPILAHTGPVGSGNYVHLDAERDWASDEGILARILAHEFGHALGLGHSLDPVALMNTEDDPRRNSLKGSDLAGLHSLYGGGESQPGDLVMRTGTCDAEGKSLTVLHGVAPADRTEVRAFDTQGDGRLELLVWRTDKLGAGALTMYSLDSNLALTGSTGPLHGICPPGTNIYLGATEDKERLLVRVDESGRAHAFRFEANGALAARPNASFVLPELADSDGDGLLDEEPPPIGASQQTPCLFSADLNSDGQTESAFRSDSSAKAGKQ